MPTIPFGDLKRVYNSRRTEIDAAIQEVLDSGWYILGQSVERFENEFAEYCDVEHAIGVANGTDAIELALRAVGVRAGDEVITSPLSAAFTALAISRIGAVPIFADVHPDTGNIDPNGISALITSRTRAILPVHLYGQPAEMNAILDIARPAGIAVVEDAAQAHGARWKGQRVGGIADAATFSFYPSKNLGAFGDGGAITTNNPTLATHMRMLRNGGQSSRYAHDIFGVNSRLDELQAAILSVRLKYLEVDNKRRMDIANQYSSALAEGSTTTRQPAAQLTARPITQRSEAESVHHLYVLVCQDRESVANYLESKGVQTAVHYPTAIHRMLAYLELESTACPHAESLADSVLSIPVYPELRDEEVSQIVSALHEIQG